MTGPSVFCICQCFVAFSGDNSSPEQLLSALVRLTKLCHVLPKLFDQNSLAYLSKNVLIYWYLTGSEFVFGSVQNNLEYKQVIFKSVYKARSFDNYYF